MKRVKLSALLFTLLLGSLFSFSYAATTSDPLFINMTSDDMHRSEMAIGFGKNQLLKGHPLVADSYTQVAS